MGVSRKTRAMRSLPQTAAASSNLARATSRSSLSPHPLHPLHHPRSASSALVAMHARRAVPLHAFVDQAVLPSLEVRGAAHATEERTSRLPTPPPASRASPAPSAPPARLLRCHAKRAASAAPPTLQISRSAPHAFQAAPAPRALSHRHRAHLAPSVQTMAAQPAVSATRAAISPSQTPLTASCVSWAPTAQRVLRLHCSAPAAASATPPTSRALAIVPTARRVTCVQQAAQCRCHVRRAVHRQRAVRRALAVRRGGTNR